MLSVNPVSFRGNLIRQVHFVRDINSPSKIKQVETTKDEFIRSYDRQIEKIQDYKNFALKLDDMMHNDAEIRQIIDELPDEMEVEIAGNFKSAQSDDDNEIEIETPILMTSEDILMGTPKAQRLSWNNKLKAIYLDLDYDNKGPDREQIINWLNYLKTFFE